MKKKNILKTIIFGGKHAVLNALNNKSNKILNIYISSEKNKKFIPSKLQSLITVKETREIDKFFKSETNHQGYCVKIEEKKQYSFEELKKNYSNYLNIVVLNNVYDDRNIGSIIRSCVAFNVKCLIVEKRNFRPDSAFMYKSASGAMEYISVYQVSNINNSLRFLKKKNYWIYCLDGSSKKNIYETSFGKKNVFVFGSEGKGINSLVKENSDEIISIPINSKIDSLNLSNSVAVTLSLTYKKSPLTS